MKRLLKKILCEWLDLHDFGYIVRNQHGQPWATNCHRCGYSDTLRKFSKIPE